MLARKHELLEGAIQLLVQDAEEKCLPQAQVESDLEHLSQAVYVKPSGQLFNTPMTTRPLFDSMDDFLQDKTKRIAVVLGNPGSGKTTFAKRWLRHRLTLFQAHAELPLPLFIELPRLGTKHLEQYLADTLGLQITWINEVKRQLALVVFLDGYDEIAYDGNLYLEKHFKEWVNAQFIVSTRHEKFGEHLASERLQAIVTRRFAPLKNPSSSFVLYELNEFSQRDIQDFVQQWENAKARFDFAAEAKESDIQIQVTQSYTHIKELRGLMELASNPMILSLILYALPDLYAQYQALPEAERQHMMRVTIYKHFVTAWFKQQGIRCMENLHKNHEALFNTLQNNDFYAEDYLRRYTENLAYSNLQCSEDGKLKLEILTADTLHSDLLHANGQALSADSIMHRLEYEEKKTLLAALRSGCLLKCDHFSFKFMHKSLIEYFTQEHIVQNIGLIDQMLYQKAMLSHAEAKASEELEEKKREEDVVASPASILSLNTMLLRDEPNVLSFLAEQAQMNAPFREALYQVMRSSKIHADLSTAAANAIMVLKSMNAPLNLESWQGIRIPNADLSYAILHGVDFRRADLHGVNLAHAYLKDANFSEALLEGCDWGSRTNISFKVDLSAIACTWDNQYVLVGDVEGTIHYVHLSSGTVSQTVTQRPWRLFSSDSEHLTRYKVRALAVDGYMTKKSINYVSACRNEIYIWTLETKGYQGKLKKHTQPITMLAYGLDGKSLASSDRHGTIWLWDLTQRTALRQSILRHAPIRFIAYTPEATLIRITQNAEIVLGFGHEEYRIPLQDQTYLSAAYDPSLDRLAVLSKRSNPRAGRLEKEYTKVSYWSVKNKHCDMEWDVTAKGVIRVACIAVNTVALGYKNGEVALCCQERGLSMRQGGEADHNRAISHLLSTPDNLSWIAALKNTLHWGQTSTMRWGGSEVNQNIVAMVYREDPQYVLLFKEPSVEEVHQDEMGINIYDLKKSMLTIIRIPNNVKCLHLYPFERLRSYLFGHLFEQSRSYLRQIQFSHYLLLNCLLLMLAEIENDTLLFLQWAILIRAKAIARALIQEQERMEALMQEETRVQMQVLKLQEDLSQAQFQEKKLELKQVWVKVPDYESQVPNFKPIQRREKQLPMRAFGRLEHVSDFESQAPNFKPVQWGEEQLPKPCLELAFKELTKISDHESQTLDFFLVPQKTKQLPTWVRDPARRRWREIPDFKPMPMPMPIPNMELILVQNRVQKLKQDLERAQNRMLELALMLAQAQNWNLVLTQALKLVQDLVQKQEQTQKLEPKWDLALKLELTKTRKKLRSTNITAFAHALPSRQEIVLGDVNGRVELLTLEGEMLLSIRVTEGHAVTAIAYAPGAALLAVATEDRRLCCFNLAGEAPVRLCNLSTLGWVICALQFHQTDTGVMMLHAGSFRGTQLQSLTMQVVSGNPAVWRFIATENKNFVPSTRGLKLQGSIGLDRKQYQLLVQQGARGNPATFFHASTLMNHPNEERRDLQQFERLLKRLTISRERLPPVKSLFAESIDVGLDNWVVVIFRSSKVNTAHNIGRWGLSGSSASDSTQHVYGLLEGLDVQGRRIFIRIDLVGPDKPTPYGRVKNKCSVANGASTADAQHAFLNLFADGRSGTPEEITYYVVGAIDNTCMHRLCTTFIADQARQDTLSKDWPRQRIYYTLLGGSTPQKVPESSRSSGWFSSRSDEGMEKISHNCLTYLYWRLSELQETNRHLRLPEKSRLDCLYVDPKHIFPRQCRRGFDARNSVHTVSVADWALFIADPTLRAVR